MTVIAVTQRTEFVPEYHETRDALDQRWHDLFALCNITPMLIPNHVQIAKKIIEQIPLQGVLLTGGNDSSARMDTENALLAFAIQNKMPVLGVCHGMQVIQKYFGIRLQDVSGHVTDKQEIFIHGKSEEVNSYHDVATFETTSDLIVWAKARDGVVKAIQHRTMPMMGMMWHPERCCPFKARDVNLIKSFFVHDI